MRGEFGGEARVRRIFRFCSFFLFLAFQVVCLPEKGFAENDPVTITADTLEYFADSKAYVATGSVKVEKNGSVTEADKITYWEDTSHVLAEGNVRYDDNEASIKARKAELNLEEKTGLLYDAEVLFKKDNYHLKGREIEKRSDNSYYSTEASFTTCDAPVPAWCFKGRNIETEAGNKLTAKDTSFRIKGLPVFYTPYLWAPLATERHTGFLIPLVGHSKILGVTASIPFFWAISENSDATFVLDTYSKRGLGTGMEYRFLGPGGVKSNWWAYHISDTELHKDFWQIQGLHEDRHDESLGGYVKINYVNEADFFREYSIRYDVRTLRFLESTGELNMPFANSRLYLLSQYRVDLQDATGKAPQKLPEAGYVLNYTRLGKFTVSADINASNNWEKDGISAARVDLYPRLLHSIGTDFVATQMVALRDTAYAFYNRSGTDINSQEQRAAFEYDLTGHTRLSRVYSSFTHVIEPSLRYHFIYSTEKDLPVFDSTELYGKTSVIELALLNRIVVKGTEVAAARVTQAIDTYKGGGAFLPLKMEVGMKAPVPFMLEASYDMNKGTLETVTSAFFFRVLKTNVSIGERYNRQEDIMMYTASADFSPFKAVRMMGSAWYGAKGEGLRDLTLAVRYLRQCWGFTIETVKSPGNFSMKIKFELAGLGSKTPRKDFPSDSQDFF